MINQDFILLEKINNLELYIKKPIYYRIQCSNNCTIINITKNEDIGQSLKITGHLENGILVKDTTDKYDVFEKCLDGSLKRLYLIPEEI